MQLQKPPQSPLFSRLSYDERRAHFKNPTAQKLLHIIEQKQTNLCVAADVTSCSELIKLIHQVGPHICMLKTHIDIIDDFYPGITQQLKALARQYNFLIFEDRKFADIGNTVMHQYAGGIYHIADWADIVNAHVIAGPGTIHGLKRIGMKKGTALLLLAHMSSAGTLATDAYTDEAVRMAQNETDFVIGFIAREYIAPHFLHFTPGVQLESGKDTLGQRYNTPASAIAAGSDVIIVGRGIYQAEDPSAAAQQYKAAGWHAYREQLNQK